MKELMAKHGDDYALSVSATTRGPRPGEEHGREYFFISEEEFEQTEAYLEHIHFYEMHIFKYSKRKGTRAAVMPDQIDEQIKAVRSEKLIALGHDMSKEFRKFYIGKNEEVLFEEKAVIGDKEYFVGYTKEYVKVAKETAENLENQIVSGRISGMLTDEILLFE